MNGFQLRSVTSRALSDRRFFFRPPKHRLDTCSGTAILPRRVPSGDHLGESSGSFDVTTGWGSAVYAAGVRAGDTAVVELHSGKVWNRYRGAGHADEESGGIHIDLQKLSLK